MTNFSKYINGRFLGIEKLESDSHHLYLLLGGEKVNNTCVRRIAYVIYIKGDYLILDYPAFDGQSNFRICNSDFYFDKKTQSLILKEVDYSEIDIKIQDWFIKEYDFYDVEIKFDGKKFLKPTVLKK